jgi:ligand-binding sensor domain-containing protein
MKMHNGKLYIAGGGRWSNRFFRPAVIMAYDTFSHSWRNWANISGAQDATCIAVDPANENHLFVSTWGEGVYEIEDSVVVEHYNHTNSSLATIFPNSSEAGRYVRTEGITYDPEGNLWMTNSEVGSTIVIRKANGEWTSLACPDIANAVLADKILVASTGLKWINLVRDKKSGIFVLDDKGTIDEAADDESAYYSSLSDLQGDIGAKEFTCIVEDLKGQIWIGTNRGPVYIPVPSRGPQGTMICQRLIYTNEYGVLDYFLKDERINAMAIDGGNRKWIGTENSGLYLISEDGLQVIEHFTASDSPLLSDCIQSLAIDNRTGELFVGTDKGLISYTGDAINGAEKYSNVYAYPNPVRPDFASNVIITGLMYDSGVKITDARGFLVFQGRSNGGQISWNCRNQSGGAVVPGIYLVLASDPDGNESVVTKIAVVR